MRVLYITSRAVEINTSSSIRNLATIIGIKELGNEVTVLSCKPNESHQAYDESMSLPDGIRRIYVELNGLKTITNITHKFFFLNKIRVFLLKLYNRVEIYDNMKNIVKYTGMVNTDDYDVIISSSDPKSSHLFAERLLDQCNSKKKWIQIWGDPFAADITQKNKKIIKKVIIEEGRLLNKADKIIYVSELTLRNQRERYGFASTKMVYIPTPILKTPIEKKTIINKATLLYAGDYSTNVRNIMPLYEAIKSIHANVSLTICGNSNINLKSSDRITILPRQKLTVVEGLEEDATILVHLSNIEGGQIPGKVFQYSGTNKPILFILDGDVSAIKEAFKKYDRYDFCLNNPESIMNKVSEIISKDLTRIPVGDFDKERIAQRILEI